MAIGFLIAFLWSVKSGQYSDTYTPSVRMLFEDEKPKEEKKSNNEIEIGIENKTETKKENKLD